MSCSKTVLVTGATGLIGKETLPFLLKKGFKVYALTCDIELPIEGVTWIHGDLFNFQEVSKILNELKPQYLLHLAWKTVGDYLTSPINYSFLSSSIHLVNEFIKNGGKKLLITGTCFEYKFKGVPLKEDDELDVEKTTYTFCKHQLHLIAERLCKEHNVDFVYARIFYVFGHGEDPTRLTGMVINNLLHNEKVVIKNGDLVKDYLYTKVIADALVHVLNVNTKGTINICSGKGSTIREYVLKIAEQLGKSQLVQFNLSATDSKKPSDEIIGNNDKLVKTEKFKITGDIDSWVNELLQNENI